MQFRTTVLTALAFLALGVSAAAAQDQFPNRAVKLVVPTTPGAVTDVLARAIGQGLSQSWGQPVVVDNRPGGDETLGVEAVAKSPADGYTLLLTSNGGITAAPHLHSHIRYDSQKDLTPIFMLGQVTPVMVVPASSPVKSVQDLIALAKSKPGELNYGSFGNGSYSHVAMEDFKLRTKTRHAAPSLQGRGARLHGPAAQRVHRHDRQPERRDRTRVGRLGADHRGGGTAALEAATGAGDGCGAGRAGLLDRRMVGRVRAGQPAAPAGRQDQD